MEVHEAIERASVLLPGTPAPENEIDPRWQAIIAVGEHLTTHPEEVWSFIAQWGNHEQDDLRAAIATCLLEHLLDAHFELIFPRVEEMALRDRLFAETFTMSSGWVKSPPEHVARLNALVKKCRKLW